MSETSKTPNFDLIEELFCSTTSPVVRARLKDAALKDIAALEARHAEEMRTAIENAKREAYEDAAKMADASGAEWKETSCGYDPRYCECKPRAEAACEALQALAAELREKAGKR